MWWKHQQSIQTLEVPFTHFKARVYVCKPYLPGASEPMRSIKPEVLEVLNRSIITATSLTLPEQLDRKLYQDVAKVVEDHGGKWNRSAKCHIFQGDPREALGIAMKTGKSENQKQKKQAYFTPPHIIDQMIDLSGLHDGMKILEPSAGEGAIVDRLIQQFGQGALHIRAVELDDGHCKVLRGKYPADKFGKHKVWVHQEDFMDWSNMPEFDAVLMNPPFTKSQDVKHILRAWELVKPGGCLLSVCSSGVAFREGKLYAQMKQIVEEHGRIDPLEDGSFKEEGTNVRTCLIHIIKPTRAS